MQEVDLMLNIRTLSNGDLNTIVDTLVALGYNDYHAGDITRIRDMFGFQYLCVEVEGYATTDVCLCTHPNDTDIVATSVDDLLIKAAEYAKGEQ